MILEKKENAKLFASLINIVLLTGLLAVCLIAYGARSFGWFAISDNSENNGLTFGIDELDSSISSITCYPVTIKNGNAITFVNDPQNTLPVYDIAGIMYSMYLPVLVARIEYDITDDKVYVLNLSSTAGIETIFYDENYISNVLSFQVATVNPENMVNFTEAVANIQSVSPISLTQISEGDIVKNSLEADVCALDPTKNEIWLVIEYNNEVVQKICDTRQYDENLDNDYIDVIYNPDITFSIK